MDSFHQNHQYMRAPPPSSTPDPYHHHQQVPLRPPIPPQGPWFPGQFQYHPSHSPSPPPSQWGPPMPHSDHALPPPPPPPPPPPGSYPLHPHPYHAQPIHHNQFPPPRPPMYPHPPPHSQVNQEWNNPSWTSPQGWEYQAQSNEEDWAARARAWADAKTAMESQQSQFTHMGRVEEQHYHHDQHSQHLNSNYPDMSQQALPPTAYEQFPVSATSIVRPPGAHHMEPTPVSSEPSPYLSDGRSTYSISNGNFGGNMNSAMHHQGKLSSSSPVNQQEVPSSNYSVTGKEVTVDQNVQPYRSLPLQTSSDQEEKHQFQHTVPAPYAYGNDPADSTAKLADQPLDFAPRFSHDHGLRMQSVYARNDSVGSTRSIDSGVTMPSLNPWTSIAPSMVYPPIPPVLTSSTQIDPSGAVPSSVPAHTPPPFGRFPGSSITPAIPSAATPFAGTGLSATVLSGDMYGLSNMSERPKKASVPNWLREEIKKAVITSSSADHPKEEIELMEDQGSDKSFTKGDHTDRSVESSRSTEEEEDDDEDDVEGIRTAQINQEIKRVLTEVLLKVTDELFDEIATKVLNEDDLNAEVKYNEAAPNQSISSLPVSTHKASAKVLTPVTVQEPYTDGTGEKSSSSSPGDVLGLGNYASDNENNDDEEEIQSTNVQSSKSNNDIEPPVIDRIADMQDAAANASAQVVVEHSGNHMTREGIYGETSSINEMSNGTDVNKLNVDWKDGEMGRDYLLKPNSKGKDNDRKLGGKIASGSNDALGIVTEHLGDNVNGKTGSKDLQDVETKMKSNSSGQLEGVRGSLRKGRLEEGELNARTKEKMDENHRKQDQRHLRKETTDDQNVQKDKLKDPSVKSSEKAKDSELRLRSTRQRHDSKEERREDKLLKGSVKDGTGRKKEYTKDNEGRTRQKISSNSSRHKSTRDRNKDKTLDHSTSDESDDTKRKVNRRKRDKSPSPIRSKRRQVSRSPHSKHSQRRHSPFSSLEPTRTRRSRSRSPVRRRR